MPVSQRSTPLGVATIILSDLRYRTPQEKLTHSIEFEVQQAGSLTLCGRGSRSTVVLGGQRLYVGGPFVWNCVRAPNKRVVKITALKAGRQDLGVRISIQDLAEVVTSARRISGK